MVRPTVVAAVLLAAVSPARAGTVRHVPLAEAPAGEELTVEATADKAWESTIRLHVRPVMGRRWTATEFQRRGDKLAAVIPADQVVAPGIEYFIDSIGKDGAVFWMSTVVKPLYNDAGDLAHYLLVFSDINDSKQIQRLQRDVLEAIAQDRPMREVMDLICRRVESIACDVVCSILGVDDDQRLRPLASPSLPPHYNAAIDGIRIGPKTGSCGTAAFWRSKASTRAAAEASGTSPKVAAVDFRSCASRSACAASPAACAAAKRPLHALIASRAACSTRR